MAGIFLLKYDLTNVIKVLSINYYQRMHMLHVKFERQEQLFTVRQSSILKGKYKTLISLIRSWLLTLYSLLSVYSVYLPSFRSSILIETSLNWAEAPGAELQEMGNRAGKVVVTDEIVDTISKSSGIEAHKIRAECQNFLKDHPRGNMNRRDFRKFLQIALPKGRAHLIINGPFDPQTPTAPYP